MDKIKEIFKKEGIGIQVLIYITAFAFFAAGSAKLLGVEAVHQSFKDMGLPAAFGYMIGTFEILGAIGLLIRRISAIAAAGLAIIMVGAIGYHLRFDLASIVVPIVLLVMCASIIRVRKSDIKLLSKD